MRCGSSRRSLPSTVALTTVPGMLRSFAMYVEKVANALARDPSNLPVRPVAQHRQRDTGGSARTRFRDSATSAPSASIQIP